MIEKIAAALLIVQECVEHGQPVRWSKLGLGSTYATAFKYVLTHKNEYFEKMYISDGKKSYHRSSYFIPKKHFDVMVHKAILQFMKERTAKANDIAAFKRWNLKGYQLVKIIDIKDLK